MVKQGDASIPIDLSVNYTFLYVFYILHVNIYIFIHTWELFIQNGKTRIYEYTNRLINIPVDISIYQTLFSYHSILR